MSPAGRRRPTSVARRAVYAMVVLDRDEVEVTSWQLAGWGRPDLEVVDRLARLQLTAGRVG